MSSIDDTEVEKQNWHWRNSMRPVRFFNLDARAAWPFVILLFHARLYTLIFTIVVTVVFRFFESRGLTFPASLRALRVWILGPHRAGWFRFRRRTMKDFG